MGSETADDGLDMDDPNADLSCFLFFILGVNTGVALPMHETFEHYPWR